MTLGELLDYLLEARDLYGNLPEVYVSIGDRLEELKSVSIEERRMLILEAEAMDEVSEV